MPSASRRLGQPGAGGGTPKRWPNQPALVMSTYTAPNDNQNPLDSTDHGSSKTTTKATSESSRHRFARFGQVLQGSGPVDVALLQATFKDRSDGIYSINRYAEDRQGTATNAVFIADSTNRTVWACRGNPDRGEWIEFQFT